MSNTRVAVLVVLALVVAAAVWSKFPSNPPSGPVHPPAGPTTATAPPGGNVPRSGGLRRRDTWRADRSGVPGNAGPCCSICTGG